MGMLTSGVSEKTIHHSIIVPQQLRPTTTWAGVGAILFLPYKSRGIVLLIRSTRKNVCGLGAVVMVSAAAVVAVLANTQFSTIFGGLCKINPTKIL